MAKKFTKAEKKKIEAVEKALDPPVEYYNDKLADEHFRNLARLRLQEEMITLLGQPTSWLSPKRN
jgi:hypothetical protein